MIASSYYYSFSTFFTVGNLTNTITQKAYILFNATVLLFSVTFQSINLSITKNNVHWTSLDEKIKIPNLGKNYITKYCTKSTDQNTGKKGNIYMYIYWKSFFLITYFQMYSKEVWLWHFTYCYTHTSTLLWSTLSKNQKHYTWKHNEDKILFVIIRKLWWKNVSKGTITKLGTPDFKLKSKHTRCKIPTKDPNDTVLENKYVIRKIIMEQEKSVASCPSESYQTRIMCTDTINWMWNIIQKERRENKSNPTTFLQFKTC